MAISYNFTGISGVGGFVFEINYIANGYLMAALVFTFFIILVISMYQAKGSDRPLHEIMTFTGFLSLIPSLILATIIYRDIPVLAVWIPIFFLMIGVAGLGMMYLFEKR